MRLITSVLLGSAATIVAVASAGAADLPTKKAAPVEYVRVCNVGGITGWTLPGSDTCVKFSGYITAQFVGGNISTQYNWASTAIYSDVTGTVFPIAVSHALPSLLVQASQAQLNTTFYRPETGWSTRTNFAFDIASNTAYGPLIGHFDINVDAGNGLDPLNGTANGLGAGENSTNAAAYLNTGYLTWAGITAGKAGSFFSFTGGGDNWANFFSPDRKGFNEPLLLAYTASFGGGFTATLSAESPGQVGISGGGTQETSGDNIQFGGQRWPDIVGALHLKQGWGEAQVSGVIHDVNVSDTTFDGTLTCGASGLLGCNGRENTVGWGVDAGVKVNLPSFGAGDNILFTGSFTENATWYSGLPDGMWGENGQVNGNGQPMYLADAYFNPLHNNWAKPTAWSVSGLLEHHFTPQFYVDLEGSIGGVNWSNQGGCSYTAVTSGLCPGGLAGLGGPLSPHAFTWLVGADLGWNPVNNLNFDLELMYQAVNQETPNGVVGTIYDLGSPLAPKLGATTGYFVPGAWEGNSNGFAGRLRITRYF
jgi:hypothetical protein